MLPADKHLGLLFKKSSSQRTFREDFLQIPRCNFQTVSFTVIYPKFGSISVQDNYRTCENGCYLHTRISIQFQKTLQDKLSGDNVGPYVCIFTLWLPFLKWSFSHSKYHKLCLKTCLRPIWSMSNFPLFYNKH